MTNKEITQRLKAAVQGQSGEIRLDCPNPNCTGGQGGTLGINADTGFYHCFRCDLKGNINNGQGKPYPQYLWDQAKPCQDHPYLKNKQVKSYGLRFDSYKNLVIPLSQHNQISTLQYIKPDGKKILLKKEKGGHKKGSFLILPGDNSIVYIAEGYATSATIHEITGATTIMTVDAGNIKPAIEGIRYDYPESRFILCADNDSHKKGLKEASKVALEIGGQVVMPEQVGQDFNDLFMDQGPEAVREQLSKFIAKTVLEQEAKSSSESIRALNLEEIIKVEIPERDYLLWPIMPSQGLVMLYAPRGIGKTYVSLSCALAMAAGINIFHWQPARPSRVLYIDGEMPAKLMQERTTSLVAGMEANIEPNNFKLITPDLSGDLPNLAKEEGQKIINNLVNDFDVLILDNLSTLIHTGKESGSDEWLPVQGWLLELRRMGKSVLMDHHAGKGGSQRGTSSREDILDTVINLKRPKDYKASEGARVDIYLEKARGVYGQDLDPFEAKLESTSEGGLAWTTRTLEDAEMEIIRDLLENGVSVRDISKETGIYKSKVQRLKKKLGM